MKYSINNYVEAFAQSLAISDKNDEVISGFIKLLKKNGDIKHSKKILDAVHRKLVNSEGGKWVTIETARELSAENLKSLKHNFSEKDHIDFKINSELVAGVRVTLNNEEELNNSLQNKLKKMFI